MYLSLKNLAHVHTYIHEIMRIVIQFTNTTFEVIFLVPNIILCHDGHVLLIIWEGEHLCNNYFLHNTAGTWIAKRHNYTYIATCDQEVSHLCEAFRP